MLKKITNLKELSVFAEEFLVKLSQQNKKETAVIIGLSGDLGSGKTAFTKCVAVALGISDVITSPTFILEKVYRIPRTSILGPYFTKLIHIDAYRLESASEMRALDWDTIVKNKNNLILIEWPEQVTEVLPKDMLAISFKHSDDGVRVVEII